jgi:hypothetical protein
MKIEGHEKKLSFCLGGKLPETMRHEKSSNLSPQITQMSSDVRAAQSPGGGGGVEAPGGFFLVGCLCFVIGDFLDVAEEALRIT